MKNKNRTLPVVLAAFFIVAGLIFPFITMNIPTFGSMLLPMHFPVILCGYICGRNYGLAVGFITPLLRSVLIGMPPLIPTALTMSFELAAYGFVTGLLFQMWRKRRFGIILSLIGGLLIGRIVWGAAAFVVYNAMGTMFSLEIFWTQAFIQGLPGVIAQLILIPIIVKSLEPTKVMRLV